MVFIYPKTISASPKISFQVKKRIPKTHQILKRNPTMAPELHPTCFYFDYTISSIKRLVTKNEVYANRHNIIEKQFPLAHTQEAPTY